MGYMNFFPSREFVRNNLITAVLLSIPREFRGIASDKCVLFLGFGDAVLDYLDNGELYYAIPIVVANSIHW
jgi:hypothetical protein